MREVISHREINDVKTVCINKLVLTRQMRDIVYIGTRRHAPASAKIE